MAKFIVKGIIEQQEDGTMRVLGVISGNSLPDAPLNLRATAVDSTFVDLAWDDGVGVLSWIIYRDGVQHDTSVVPSYTDNTSITPDTDYEYKVRAVNGAGQSGLSDALIVTTAAQVGASTPTGFEIDTITRTSVAMSWNAQIDAVTFNVYRDGILITPVSTNSYVDTGLDDGVTYSYRIAATNDSGTSALTDPLQATTLANNIPEWVIEDQTVSQSQSYTLDLRSVCNDLDNDPLTFSIISGSVPGIAVNGSNLTGVPTTAGATSLGLRVNDGFVNTDTTITFTVVAVDTTAPSVPQNVVATANGSTVTVNWTESTDTSGIWTYRIRRNGAIVASYVGGVAFATGQEGSVAGPPFVQTGVPNGTYTYEVRAIDNSPAQNASADGVAAPVTVGVVQTFPDVPIFATPTVVSSSQINLSWTAGSSGATPTSYELDRSTAANGPWTNILTDTTLPLSVSHPDTGLAANTQYFYRLRALAGANASAYATQNATTNSSTGVSDTPNYNDPVSGVTLIGGRTTVNVNTANELTLALGNAVAGQTIQLAPGTYAGNFTYNKTAPANNPIIIKGAANLASTITGSFTLGGVRGILLGVRFNGANARVVFSAGNNNKCLACSFSGWTTNTAISLNQQALNAEIAFNELFSPGAWGPFDPNVTQLRIGIRSAEGTNAVANFPYGAWIHHNYFHDFPDKPVSNNYGSGQSDAIEPGQTQSGERPGVNCGWYIEFNLIKDHLQGQGIGAGTIDWKVSGGCFRHNTFDNVFGRMDIRGSSEYPMVWEGNWIQSSSKGSVFHGCGGGGHVVIGNRYVPASAGMWLQAGNMEADTNPVIHANFPGGGHAAARDIKLYANNITGTTTVGGKQDPDRIIPANRTVIQQHTGPIALTGANIINTNTVDQRNQNTTRNYRPAFRIFAADVGPSAIAGTTTVGFTTAAAFTAWKAARGI